MKSEFQGWDAVANCLVERAALVGGRLNQGQLATLRAIAERIRTNGLIIADEVGMGKTRVAVELARCVALCGGRTAVVLPPGLGFQWQAEMREGGIDVPAVIRSLQGFYAPWQPAPEPAPVWADHQVLMLSHALANWRLGESAASWRWALLPEVAARLRKASGEGYPHGYRTQQKYGEDAVVQAAAQSIVDALMKGRWNPARQRLEQFINDRSWRKLLGGAAYASTEEARTLLETAVGAGLGSFDLVIIDEAHKSRDEGSGLSRVLDSIVLQRAGARRVSLTATPVELNENQWAQTLSRIGVPSLAFSVLHDAINDYAQAVRRVRQSWRGSVTAREDYAKSAARFQDALSPYLLRRNKAEDDAVLRFRQTEPEQPVGAYRREAEIAIKLTDLSPAWRTAVCATEALSFAASGTTDTKVKRLRLTIGNGHSLAAVLDELHGPANNDSANVTGAGDTIHVDDEALGLNMAERKRDERVQWWRTVMARGFEQDERHLFAHPAICATVQAIETETRAGQKVLVFGRYTRPMRALVQLLNAREMLRRLEKSEASEWPQAKVHVSPDGNADYDEWAAVRAAHAQLKTSIPIDEIDARLKERYEALTYQRRQFKERLLNLLGTGFDLRDASLAIRLIFEAFAKSVAERLNSANHGDNNPLSLIARALMELLPSGFQSYRDEDLTRDLVVAFGELVTAACDADDFDDVEDANPEAADKLWARIEERVCEEYASPQGGFARLMHGDTPLPSRRMLQLSFNRQQSFPHVLVAQSMVGREGLNLHKACRIVVLLHPEWNPGVVEQQIGRVDRVGSRWATEYEKAIADGGDTLEMPRIDVRPVVFHGTYDEYNWKVLRGRSDDLRAQLHGIVIPPAAASGDEEALRILHELESAAPDFSPNRRGRGHIHFGSTDGG